MGINKQDQHDRVLAYHLATPLTYEETDQVAGGNIALYWTMYRSGVVVKQENGDSKIFPDGSWDH